MSMSACIPQAGRADKREVVFGIRMDSQLLLICLLLLEFRGRDTGLWNRVVPWLTLGAVILVTACGMDAERAGFSPLPRAW